MENDKRKGKDLIHVVTDEEIFEQVRKRGRRDILLNSDISNIGGKRPIFSPDGKILEEEKLGSYHPEKKDESKYS